LNEQFSFALVDQVDKGFLAELAADGPSDKSCLMILEWLYSLFRCRDAKEEIWHVGVRIKGGV
jgi:hypothetical protein